jgi:hypothetical protein
MKSDKAQMILSIIGLRSDKAPKILAIVGVGLLLLQLPWFFIAQSLVVKSQTKTVATVIRIENMESWCTGDRPGRSDPTCDHSLRQYPVYEYFDLAGQRYEQDDRFFGEYKQNNPLRKLFWRDVGDKVTAYYTPDKPQEVLFMAGPLAYTAWLIPSYLAMCVFLVAILLLIIKKLK